MIFLLVNLRFIMMVEDAANNLIIIRLSEKSHFCQSELVSDSNEYWKSAF